MHYTFRMNLLPYHNPAAIREVFVKLVVQLHPVGHEDKAPVSGIFLNTFAQRKSLTRFSRSLCMPEHAQLSSIRVNPLQGLDGVVRAQVLMILSDKLDESDLRLHEEREVFDEVEQPFVIAQSLSMVSNELAPCSSSELTRFHSAKCSQLAVNPPNRLWEPLETIIRALYQNRWGMVSL